MFFSSVPCHIIALAESIPSPLKVSCISVMETRSMRELSSYGSAEPCASAWMRLNAVEPG